MTADSTRATADDAGPTTPDASVVVVAYRTGPDLVDCVSAIRAEGDAVEVIVVDNGSAGSEIARVEELGARVVGHGDNLGFAAGCNLGAGVARAAVLVFLNPDTVARPGAVGELAAVVESDHSIGSAMAMVTLADQERLNTSGNLIHLTGHGWSGGFGDPVPHGGPLREVVYPSGAAMAMRAELFSSVGGFCEELFLYHEDLELGWRLQLMGLRNVAVPSARVVHDYEYGRNATKYRYIERNRLVFLLTCLPTPLLAAVFPLVLALEVATLALATKQGWLGEKLYGYRWLARNTGWVRYRRRQVLGTRRVSTAELAALLRAELDPAMPGAPATPAVANRLMRLYWSLVHRLV